MRVCDCMDAWYVYACMYVGMVVCGWYYGYHVYDGDVCMLAGVFVCAGIVNVYA